MTGERDMRMTLLLIGTMLWASAFTAQPQETPRPQLPQQVPQQPGVRLAPELARVLTDYEVSWRAGDGAALARLFDEDGFVLPNGAPPVRRRAAIGQYYKGPGGPRARARGLWKAGRLARPEPPRFHTRSGLLTAVRQGEWIELDFPATPEEAAEAPPGLAEALGAAPLYVGRSRFDYLVELDDEETVRNLRPDFGLLAAIEARGVRARSRAAHARLGFVSRFFAPASGINEEPVTGSSHCCLAPFWSRRLGKERFLARQVSARGGVLKVRLEGDRVLLGGQAITVLRSELLTGMGFPGRGPGDGQPLRASS